MLLQGWVICTSSPDTRLKVQTIKRGHHEKVIREQKTSTKRRFSTLFKQQAVERADKDGVAQVAKRSGITPGLIYNWRNSLANQSSEQRRNQAHAGRKCETKAGVKYRTGRSCLFKKSGGVFCESAKVKYALIQKYADQKQIAHRCKLLGVSRSGYYEWRIKGTLSSAPRNAIKTEEVQKAFYDLKRRYGSLRITRLLREKGVIISRKTVAKLCD